MLRLWLCTLFLYLEHQRTEVPGNEATLVWCVCGHTVFAGWGGAKHPHRIYINSSVHAWPFIVLLTTPSRVYFLMIAEYGEGGRLDLTGMEGYFWNANSREQYMQWCMKRVAYIPRLYSPIFRRYHILERLGYGGPGYFSRFLVFNSLGCTWWKNTSMWDTLWEAPCHKAVVNVWLSVKAEIL